MWLIIFEEKAEVQDQYPLRLNPVQKANDPIQNRNRNIGPLLGQHQPQTGLVQDFLDLGKCLRQQGLYQSDFQTKLIHGKPQASMYHIVRDGLAVLTTFQCPKNLELSRYYGWCRPNKKNNILHFVVICMVICSIVNTKRLCTSFLPPMFIAVCQHCVYYCLGPFEKV